MACSVFSVRGNGSATGGGLSSAAAAGEDAWASAGSGDRFVASVAGDSGKEAVAAEKGPAGTATALTPAQQRKFDYFFYEGLKQKNAGKYDAAFDLFTHCMALDSTSSAVLYELSNFYEQLERPDRAVELLKRAVAGSPGNFTYRIALAGISRDQGMYGEAAEEFEKLVADYPGKPELNYYLAEVYTQQGEIEKAIAAYDALESSMGMNEAISMQKYKLYASIEQNEQAFGEIEKLAKKFPEESRYQLILGDLYLEKNDTVRARGYYDRAHEIDPSNPYYIVAMANYYEHTGHTDAAQRQIRDALVNPKLDVDTKVGILSRYIVRLQQSQQGTESANALFDILLELHPNETKLNLMYGTLLQMQGKNDDAKFQFALVAESEPENIEAWQELLSLALKSEDIPEVIRICEKCIELFPKAPQFYFYLGIGYYQQKAYEKALDAYRAGIAVIDPENTQLLSDFYGQTGDIHYQMKQLDQAYEAYDQALKYNPKNVLVLNNYSYFLSTNGGDLKKAERMSAQCIRLEPDNATYLDTYAWIFFMQGNYTLAKIYIESAMGKDGEKSPEIIEHYGDILYKNGEVEKAVEQWKKAKELNSESTTLDRKIETKTYIEEEVKP